MNTALSSSPVWAEVSRRALLTNHKILSRKAAPARLIPVVKADGYGLGASWVLRQLRPAQAAVMTAGEGARLRDQGYRGRILLLSPASTEGLRLAGDAKLVPSVSTLSQVRDLGRPRSGQGDRVSLEVNSGMNRLGCEPWELPLLASAIRRAGWKLAGVYTHFPRATEDRADTVRSARVFRMALRLAGLEDVPNHASASAALVRHGAFGFSHARPGLALYGADPIRGRKLFKPVLSLRARVQQIRKVAKGAWVSYGRSYRSPRPLTLAVLGLGYADGWRRILGNRARALVRGGSVPLVGRVCMDMVMADVSKVPGVREGDRATLIGGEGKDRILLEEVAEQAGTIPYEILTGLGSRVVRVEVA